MNEDKLAIKKIEDMNLEKYKKKDNYINPYFQQYGWFIKKTESKVFDEDEDEEKSEEGKSSPSNNENNFVIDEEHPDSQTSLNDFDVYQENKKSVNFEKNSKNTTSNKKKEFKRRVSIIVDDFKPDSQEMENKKKSFYDKRKTSEMLEYSKVKEMLKEIDINDQSDVLNNV